MQIAIFIVSIVIAFILGTFVSVKRTSGEILISTNEEYSKWLLKLNEPLETIENRKTVTFVIRKEYKDFNGTENKLKEKQEEFI